MKEKIKLSWITFIVIGQCIMLLIASGIIGITGFLSRQNDTSDMLKKNTSRVAVLLEENLNNIFSVADNSYLNISVQQALKLDNAQQSTVYDKFRTNKLIESLYKNNAAISDILIYPLLGKPYHIRNSILDIKDCYELREQEWFRNISKLESGFTLLPGGTLLEKGMNDACILFGRTMYASSSRKIIGYQFIAVNKEWIKNTVQDEEGIIKFYVCDKEHNALLLNEKEQKEFYPVNRKAYFTEEVAINNQLQVVGRYKKADLFWESWKSIIHILVLMCPVMIVSILCCSIWVKWIKRPAKELTNVMKCVGTGNFVAKMPQSKVEEIDILSRQFFQMLDELAVEKEQNKKLEMRLLLAQLNPHFLYNTLNSIYWMILDGEREDEAAEMIDALSNLLQYGLYDIDSDSTIKREVEHAEQYLLLQSKRYDDRLSYHINIEENLYSMKIPKLTLNYSRNSI